MTDAITVEPARRDEWESALRLIFRHAGPVETQSRARNALRLIESGELDPAGVLVARMAGRIQGAMVCMIVPGASALVWPPQALERSEKKGEVPFPQGGSPHSSRTVQGSGQRSRVEDALLAHASNWAQAGGARLAQTLLSADETALSEPLERNGFRHITRLRYLRHELASVPEEVISVLTFESYANCSRELFHRTLVRTYEMTRDCPEVNGVRTIEEVVEGHRAQGVFDPSRWVLAHCSAEPVGVLLLAEVPDLHAWDISYLGVVPEARNKGVGRSLVNKALWEAHRAKAPQLTLAVDDRNEPALRLYRSCGFVPFDLREVYLAVWRPAHA